MAEEAKKLYKWGSPTPKDKRRRRINAKAIALMMRMMMGKRCTMADLVESSGLCLHTVRAYVKALHLAGVCHISGWKMDKRGAFTTPTWTIGVKDDVEKPKQISSADRMRTARRRDKAISKGYSLQPIAFLVRAKQGYVAGEVAE